MSLAHGETYEILDQQDCSPEEERCWKQSRVNENQKEYLCQISVPFAKIVVGALEEVIHLILGPSSGSEEMFFGICHPVTKTLSRNYISARQKGEWNLDFDNRPCLPE